jgi:hypothetical protein
MAAPSYLRQAATRQTAALGRTTVAPQRILFRPILQHTGPLEAAAEATPPRSPIADLIPAADAAISAQLPIGAELSPLPARPQRQWRHLEPEAPGRSGASPSVVARLAEQEIPDAPTPRQAPSGLSQLRPSAARDLARASSPIRDPEPARNATGRIGFALGRASPVSNPDREPRPVWAAKQPESQAPRLLMPHDNRQEPRYSFAAREAAESEAARGERIQLTPSLNRARRETSNATAGSETARGGVHIGSLEVHVSAPPVAADPPRAPSVPQPGVGSGRAIAPLVRGFPGFGLVQS